MRRAAALVARASWTAAVLWRFDEGVGRDARESFPGALGKAVGLPTSKRLCLKAQGCDEGATLGKAPENMFNLEEVVASDQSRPQPLRGWMTLSHIYPG